MATTIDIRDLPDRFDELVAQAVAGGEVIVTEGGMPRALLVPIPTAKPRIAGMHLGAIEIAPDFDEPLSDEFWVGQPSLPWRTPSASELFRNRL